MANLSCCTFAIKLYSVKNRGRVGSGGNFDKRCDIRCKWNVPFSCFWKFRPLDRLDLLREEIRGQKESRQMKISIAASRAQANSPPLVERETRWNITKVFLGSRARAPFFHRDQETREELETLSCFEIFRAFKGRLLFPPSPASSSRFFSSPSNSSLDLPSKKFPAAMVSLFVR